MTLPAQRVVTPSSPPPPAQTAPTSSAPPARRCSPSASNRPRASCVSNGGGWVVERGVEENVERVLIACVDSMYC